MTAELCAEAPRRIRLSWSKLKNYEQCHQRSHLLDQGHRNRVLNGRGFLPGTLADRCMRSWLEERRFEPGGMLKFLEQHWLEHTGPESEYAIKWRGDPGEDMREVLRQVKQALIALEPILMDKVVPYAFRPEYRFTAVIGIPGLNGETVQIEIFGAVDVASYFGESRYGLFDLKITLRDEYIRSTLAQLIFYDLAFRGWTGVHPVEHAFWTPLMKEKVIPLTVTDDDRRHMISRIIAYCHGVWRGEWQLTSDETQCYSCLTKHACPRFVNQITTDEQGRHRTSFQRSNFKLMDVEVASDG